MEKLFIISSMLNDIILGFIVGSIITLPFLLILVAYKILAPKNIFFSMGKENCIMYVMSGGKFSGKIIFPSKNLYVDKNYNIKTGNHNRKFNIFGMYWIGIYPFYSIYKRNQRWMEWESTKDGRIIRFRDEKTPYLIAKPFEYAMILDAAEDKNEIPLNIKLTITIIPRNAILPIFGNDNAYGQLQTVSLSQARTFVKRNLFSKIGGNITEEINANFSKFICSMNEKIPGRSDDLGIPDALGYEILDAKLDQIEIAGANKEELIKASTVVYIAEENSKAEIHRAEGDKKAKVIRAEGEKESAILKAEGEKTAGMLGIDVEKYRMETREEFYKKIKNMPHAQQIELAKKIFEDSNLTTFVSGKDTTPTINIGGN
jgi:hypothetical protein